MIKTINPRQRMLTREMLFSDGDFCWENQSKLDQYMLTGNTWRGWLKSVFARHEETNTKNHEIRCCSLIGEISTR